MGPQLENLCLKVLFLAQTRSLLHFIISVFFAPHSGVLQPHASRVGLRMRSSGAQLLEREPGENGNKQFNIHAVRAVFFGVRFRLYRGSASLGKC